MNLQSEIREVRSRLSAPARTTNTDNFFTDPEIMDWIYAAELKILNEIVDDALTDVQSATATTTVNGTSSYPLPDDFQRMLDIQLNVGAGLRTCRLINPKKAYLLDDNPNWRPTPMIPYAWIYAGEVNVRPVPGSEAGAGKLSMRYVARPSQRFKHAAAYTSADGNAGGSTVIDTARTEPDDYWNDCGLRLTDGAFQGQELVVTDWVNSTGTFTVSGFAGQVLQSIDYEVGEISSLGAEFSPLIVAWATYLGFVKDADIELAQIQAGEFTALVERMNQRYGFFHRQEPSQEVPR